MQRPQMLTEETENTVFPVVLIISSDVHFVQPIREYIQSRGLTVAINSEDIRNPLHIIFCGNWDFVKDMLAQFARHTCKRLLILRNISDNFISDFFISHNVKIIINPPEPLTSRVVSEIFTLFVNSKDHIIKLSHVDPWQAITSPAYEGTLSPVNHGKVHEDTILKQRHALEDKQRVDYLLSTLYSKSLPFLPFNAKQNTNKSRSRHGSKTQYSKHFAQRFMVSFLQMFLGALAIYGFLNIISIVFTLITIGSLKLTSQFLVSGKRDYASVSLFIAKNSNNNNKFILPIIVFPMKFLQIPSIATTMEHITGSIDHINQSIESLLSINQYSEELTEYILSDRASTNNLKTTSKATVIQKLLSELKFVDTNLGLASAGLTAIQKFEAYPFTIQMFDRATTEVVYSVYVLRQSLQMAEKLLTLYTKTAGFGNEKKYLILLQNSAELRPTGGFIGSVGSASFQEGKVTEFIIRDVYDLDGQLKGHVDPPPEVNGFLGQEHWYLRDSNWDPDFAQSAQRAAWFYEKTTGSSVDGVIAVNTLLFVDLLRTIGPIELPDYNETITEDNFFGKSLFYTQNNFFPGSTQKKDFLGNLARAVILKVTTGQKVSSQALFRVLQEGLSKKNILFWSSDEDVMRYILKQGWGGAVTLGDGCDIELTRGIPCLTDYIAVSEANMSINKVNVYIKKRIQHTAMIRDDGTIDGEIRLSYDNTSNSASSGGGTYLPYTRVLLPKDAQAFTVLLDGKTIRVKQPEDVSFTLPYYDIQNYNDSLVSVGVAFNIEPLSQRHLTVRFNRTIQASFLQGTSVYELRYFKQPGQDDVPLTITIKYPNNWNTVLEKESFINNIQTVRANETFLAKGSALEYNGNLSTDIRLKAHFSQ